MFDIYNDDCLKIMKTIPDNSIDCIVTDPPYGMAFQSNRAKDGPRHEKISNDDIPFLDWIEPAYSILKDGGAVISFCDWNTSHLWRNAFEQAGFIIKSQCVWDRMHHGMGDLHGSFAPQHDIIWYAVKGKRKFVNGRPKSVLSHKRPSPTEDFGHPTCKPVSLMRELIYAIDDGSDGIIFEPFMGSGSTGKAAQELNRKFIGVELNTDYFKIAEQRLSETTDFESV